MAAIKVARECILDWLRESKVLYQRGVCVYLEDMVHYHLPARLCLVRSIRVLMKVLLMIELQ